MTDSHNGHHNANKIPKNISEDDLQIAISSLPKDLWQSLNNARIFITGGTGFFGTWILETLAWAIQSYSLQTEAVILSRNGTDSVKSQRILSPEMQKHFHFHKGDVRSFEFPKGKFTHIIHAATSASAAMNSENPMEMIDTIIEGTRRTLQLAHDSGAKRFLLTSSGAIYGKIPPSMNPESQLESTEDFYGILDCTQPSSAYAEGKRLAELMCASFYQQHKVECVIARCFAFVGPYLPLNTHFAIGNFIGDAISGRTIHIKGDGSPVRSYLYAADLSSWLWTLLLRGQGGRAYNVGSDREITLRNLALTIVNTLKKHSEFSHLDLNIEIQNHSQTLGVAHNRYVPNVQRIKSELGVQENFNLSDAIIKTAQFYSSFAN